MGFFVQSILADRYIIHRTELRLVSLVNSSSVEYGIKKIFLIFVFYKELSRFKLFYIFVRKCCLVFLNIKKILSTVLFFCRSILANYFKIQTFSSKTARNKFL